jgi:hypothetical protein
MSVELDLEKHICSYPSVARVSHWQQMFLPCVTVHPLADEPQPISSKVPTVDTASGLETRVPLFHS